MFWWIIFWSFQFHWIFCFRSPWDSLISNETHSPEIQIINVTWNHSRAGNILLNSSIQIAQINYETIGICHQQITIVSILCFQYFQPLIATIILQHQNITNYNPEVILSVFVSIFKFSNKGKMIIFVNNEQYQIEK